MEIKLRKKVEKNKEYECTLRERAAKAERMDPVKVLAYDMIRKKEEGVKSIAITSNGPKEGKTQVIELLGEVLAEHGYRTLIIDANYFSPGITGRYLLGDKNGLINLLEEYERLEIKKQKFEQTVESIERVPNILPAKRNDQETKKESEVVIEEPGDVNLSKFIVGTSVRNLFVIPIGVEKKYVPWNQSIALNMKLAMEDLQGRFDFIILELSALTQFSYVQSFCPYIDGISFVLRTGSLKLTDTEEVKEKLQKLPCKKLGCILVKSKKNYQLQPNFTISVIESKLINVQTPAGNNGRIRILT